jgi:hypothetical protein
MKKEKNPEKRGRGGLAGKRRTRRTGGGKARIACACPDFKFKGG